MPVETAKMLVATKNRTKCVGVCQRQLCVCVDLQAVGALEFFGELYRGLGPFLRGFGQALEKGSLVTTSTSPSLQAYAVLHVLPASRVDKPLVL